MKIEIALQHLGLETSATEADVKQAYRELVKIWHPDRFQNDERLNSRTEAQLKIINEAKTVALAYLEKHGHFLLVGTEQPRKKKPPAGPRGPEREWSRPPPREEPRARTHQKPPPREEPKKEAPPEPEPEPEISFEPPAPGFNFGQNALIVVFILLVLVSFVILLISSMGETPADKVKQFTRKPPAVSELRKAMAEKDAREGVVPYEEEEEEIPEPPPESPQEAAVRDTFFTLGSDKEWVSTVQGPPLQIKGDIWRYGHSMVEFEYGVVIGWNSSELNPLKVGMIQDPSDEYRERYFYIGSLKSDVIALQGAPSVIEKGLWKYGDAFVQFEGDTVINWQNDHLQRLKAVEY
jgi:hypothetical protein